MAMAKWHTAPWHPISTNLGSTSSVIAQTLLRKRAVLLLMPLVTESGPRSAPIGRSYSDANRAR